MAHQRMDQRNTLQPQLILRCGADGGSGSRVGAGRRGTQRCLNQINPHGLECFAQPTALRADRSGRRFHKRTTNGKKMGLTHERNATDLVRAHNGLKQRGVPGVADALEEELH